MRIRKATLTDAAIIADFNCRLAWETEQIRLDSATVNRGVRAVLKDEAKGTYFVVEADGEVIGQLLITYEWSDWRNGNFWWIQSVYVVAAYRQQGIFRALFEHVRKVAWSRRGVCGLRLYAANHNRRAQRAYLRLGMTHTDYEVFELVFR